MPYVGLRAGPGIQAQWGEGFSGAQSVRIQAQGFAFRVFSAVDETGREGAANSVAIGEAFAPEGGKSDIVEPGVDLAIGSIPCKCAESSGHIARTRGSGTGLFKY